LIFITSVDEKIVDLLRRSWILLSSAFSSADEYLTSKSPDGKFALHVSRGDKQPFPQSSEIVDAKTRQVILALNKDSFFDPEAKLVWSNDSQWAAYLTVTGEVEDEVATRVFVRKDNGFEEIKMPYLSPPKQPERASRADDRHPRIIPIRWTKPGLLELEYEILSDAWGRTADHVSIQFDKNDHEPVVKSEPEAPSIVDYYLLLPKDAFETPPRHWLHNARVDKENGYMDVSGDGAQPSFQVALFRYRDGRPLLAICSDELEGFEHIALQFFELGTDGKMDKAPRSIFPIADQWSTTEDDKKYSDFRFDLPRRGRTVLVRSAKTKKIVHRVTWNGEKFLEEK
jgi:hypothetical protein